MRWHQRLAVAWVLGSALFAIGTFVWACVPPAPPAPQPEEIVIVPAVPVKSLAHWWEVCDIPHKGGKAYYVGSVSRENLVLRRNHAIPGGVEWGPAVREGGYRVNWRGDYGSGLEVLVGLRGWSLEQARADVERCEGRPVKVSLYETPESSPLP